MSEQIREQISAFLDGELPGSETELLLKRLIRDAQLRESFGRYALIGECLRGGGHARMTAGFADRVIRAIDGEPAAPGIAQAAPSPRVRWWRPVAGAGVAAAVAAVAVVALQQRAISPTLPATVAQVTPNGGGPASHGSAVAENAQPDPRAAYVVRAGLPGAANGPVSYVVPPTVAVLPAAMPSGRLTSYVFAHAKYGTVLGQNDVLNDLLSNSDSDAATEAERDHRVDP
jgi:sigma-E factor negative regulatory protein RseA